MVTETFEFIARYLWPAVLAWNIYLFRKEQANELAIVNLRLYISENYTSKRDLEKMFSDFENRLETRLNERFSMFEQIIKK
ncbi:hypothetical protein [Desulfoluna butyratoxydans]|uniref:Uncharacterized protein n=1 Tax=Desulfoluna butyratoxydans TaxID=231438 RepID=A0A4U8YZR4_9BACT|nr:hypothetical protein [Desulfoluna butyratoxydans]VFQ42389.1 hypothetical protein MSL71_70 [Desulfoluna butyratoxydans]VFQ47403.1 hypothetical protein MSL71_51030 [Desulfoluna butyratoxydans]